MKADRFRIGFDIGGTFTDFILLDAVKNRVHLHKALTTPRDPADAALAGIRDLCALADILPADVTEIIHGTTLVTNAIIERSGARLGLLTTRGFKDVLEMGTEQRYDIYDLFLRYPNVFVPRDRRLEITERVDRDGRIVTALDEDEVAERARSLAAMDCKAIAISFLNSYRNADHEGRAAEIVRAVAPNLAVSTSADVIPELSEYQRTVTTCANAYVLPLMDAYLGRLERDLADAGFAGDFRLMHSAGGLMSAETARRYPIRLIESGPAGGALATALFGQIAGLDDVISFDMGGTTAKACMIEDGRCEGVSMIEAARVHRFTKGSGLPIKTPVIDMIEIGAGGGSIASIDEVGLLKIGPQSAGSNPGPACYGLGGNQPTVTDANLLLGYYDPDFFLGGRMRLDTEAAARTMAPIARDLSLKTVEAAWGVHKVVVENMAAAARVHLVEKGKDPRRYAMVGFGGAGPAHAADVARVLGVRDVIIPPASGAASALGFLAAPISFEAARSVPVAFDAGFDASGVDALLRDLEVEGLSQLRTAGIETAASVEHMADMRIVGQMHEITVVLPKGEITPARLPEIREAFVTAYTARYTRVPDEARIEAISFRVTVRGPEPTVTLSGATGEGMADTIKGTRRAWFEDGWADATVYNRYALRVGMKIEGPAIIEEREATTVIAHGDKVRVDDALNLCISVATVKHASAVVTPDMPLEAAVAAIEADPVSLEIVWSRMITVVEEMWLTVCRTAFSLVISEAQDFACELLDPMGETLAHSPRAMPVFNLTLPRAVKALLKRYPAETLQPGDVLVTNDPWLCAGHLFDVAIVTPVFRGGRLVALTGTVGHVSDIGGTKDSMRAREIYEEGFQIPPMKIYEAGQANETLIRLFRENVRNADQVLGDVESFIAANAIGAKRLTDFMEDYGLSDLRALAAVVQGRSERAMRDAIRDLPDGRFTGTITNNPLGTPLTYPVAITVEDDRIDVDFEGAPPQLSQGGFNSTMNYTTAHATYPLKCMLTPNVRGNAGCYRPFTVNAPKGSILNCRKPAAVNLRTRTGWYLAPLIFAALAEAAPDQVQAFTGLPVALNIYGDRADGILYSDMLFIGGGQGASASGDGISGLLWPTSAANTSIELFESRVPVLVLEKSYISDTGGAGEHRGGLGQRVRIRKLSDDGETTLVSVYPEGVGNPVDGLFGGRPGGEPRGIVTDVEGRLNLDCGTGQLVELSAPDQIVDVILAGGSGYGKPTDRSETALDRDLALGLITPDGAARSYRGLAGAKTRQEAAE